MSNRENMIQAAIADFRSGAYPSQRAAAAAYGIPRSTLSTRIAGRQSSRVGHQNQQRLTPAQEEFIADWILEEADRGYPPSHARAREMAARFLRANGDLQPLGHKWVSHFKERNPRVATVIGRRIEASRIKGTSPEQLQAFFDLFQRVQAQYNIHPANTWNMDEVGIALGVCTNSCVLASSKKKRAYVSSPEDREWVSIIEAVSSTGGSIRPLIIFKGVNLQSTWFNERTPSWTYTTSTNGWTSNQIGHNWLIECFMPETKPDGDEYRMLVLDGHGSHVTVDFAWTCKQNRIEVVYLPPHSSHVLQPLDLSCFSPVKTRYRAGIAALATLDDSAPVKKRRFLELYNLARSDSLTPKVIRNGWKAAGIYPWNPAKALGSSQVVQRPSQRTQKAATPPPRPDIYDPRLFQTPRSSQQLHKLAEYLGRREKLSRDGRLVLAKARKALSQANTKQAQLEDLVQQQKAQIEATMPQLPRKKVAVDPNTRFANIENIHVAVEASRLLSEAKSAKKAKAEAERASREIEAQELQTMCM